MHSFRPRAFRFVVVAFVAAAVTALLMLVTGPLGAQVQTTSSAADESPPHLVEDYTYPGAEQILAERGIELLKGNGKIMLADCGGTGLIQVRSAEAGLICFDITLPAETGAQRAALRPRAWLTMRIPSVYVIRGDEHDTEAVLTANDVTSTYELTPNAWTPVGEGVDPENGPAVLLRLETY